VTWRPLAAIGGVLSASAAGFVTILDPAFLAANPDLVVSLGFTVVKGGQELAPGFPWQKVILVLVTLSIMLTLSRVHEKRKQP
jgi:hypothetical protein